MAMGFGVFLESLTANIILLTLCGLKSTFLEEDSPIGFIELFSINHKEMPFHIECRIPGVAMPLMVKYAR